MFNISNISHIPVSILYYGIPCPRSRSRFHYLPFNDSAQLVTRDTRLRYATPRRGPSKNSEALNIACVSWYTCAAAAAYMKSLSALRPTTSVWNVAILSGKSSRRNTDSVLGWISHAALSDLTALYFRNISRRVTAGYCIGDRVTPQICASHLFEKPWLWAVRLSCLLSHFSDSWLGDILKWRVCMLSMLPASHLIYHRCIYHMPRCVGRDRWPFLFSGTYAYPWLDDWQS
ncbi:hypothetical protein MBM_02869 [Drepanopeziza brunnea f. sp. 'multigermtubi' MB_m1]|uniref:Uncharacterized protein n=1 Tax=Marssonina brunnea f. sp. multigermtubi (strain MB_m1) TaxID=1072389 RepID=K1X0Y3_MARBU|nr:uncharacterized protein MBM_02869 [Drepanopeziza brunnea f. sp. 'multigermtubi' MB_m1]EKD18627.1 hypothetical protein MBM_02869 [Drepanopeziza brunnea f. sp. 'multigermtubi' MB_m1]